MSDLIDREHLLSEIAELKKSPWFNEDYLGSKLVRKEAIEIVEDLCIKKEPGIATDDFIIKWISEAFDSPCNGYRINEQDIAEFMFNNCSEWCNKNCGEGRNRSEKVL